MQTLAYMLPVLSLALQKAEAEFEQLATMGKAHTAGMLHADNFALSCADCLYLPVEK